MSLEKTGQELERTAIQVAGIAVELNAVAKDLNDFELRSTVEQSPNDCGQLRAAEKWREHLRLRAQGLQAEAARLALAALSAARAGEQIACASRSMNNVMGANALTEGAASE